MNNTYFKSDNEDLEKAFRIASGDIAGNISLYKAELLQQEESVLMAGMSYNRPWTRDAAINVWNGFGLINREISKNTLISMLTEDEYGRRIGGQYWDAIIWVTGAWNFYLYSGDRSFLEDTMTISLNSLKYFENTEYDSETELFRGAPCYADGISAYPDRYTSVGSYHDIQYWAEQNTELRHGKGEGLPIEALSTNCLYFNAYKLLSVMAFELGIEIDPIWNEKERKIKKAINNQLWMEDKGYYRYFIDPWNGSDAQDGLGHSLAILFGVADEEQQEKILINQHISPMGIPCLWPVFDRYNDRGDHVGRHNGTVWPHIQGFWGSASAGIGNKSNFEKELKTLTNFAIRDGQFGEVFHPETGVEYGGLQENSEGVIEEYFLCHRQTWSATAYLRLILTGLFGMNFSPDGIHLSPIVPPDCSFAQLHGLDYRRMKLSISINGTGEQIQSFLINGKSFSRPFIPSDLEGEVSVEIILK
jgi:glycogen debranching enzyme